MLLQFAGLVIIMPRHENMILDQGVHTQLNINCRALLKTKGLETFAIDTTDLTNITPYT